MAGGHAVSEAVTGSEGGGWQGDGRGPCSACASSDMQKVPGAGFLIVGGSDLGCVEEMAQGLQQQPQVARQRGSEALALPSQAQVARQGGAGPQRQLREGQKRDPKSFMKAAPEDQCLPANTS